MNEEMQKALADLKDGLEGKSKETVKAEVKAIEEKFEAKLQELQGENLKAFKEENEALKAEIKEVKEHAAKLDVKMSAPVSKEKKSFGVEMAEFIRKNIGEIGEVRKGHSVKLETKAVGDMTLGAHLTGDQPRDYSFNVAAVPGRLVHVVDILGPAVTISGGTYTFPRETASEGSISTQTEGASKTQIDYDLSMIDVNTDFTAGFARYSKKMRNNLPFLESFLPQALRRDYMNAVDTRFAAAIVAGVSASAEVAASHDTLAEQLIKEIANLEASNYSPNVIVVTPADWYAIAVSEKSAGAGYGLPGIASMDGGVLRLNGVPVVKANWLAANKYLVGDFSRIYQVTTEGLSLEFSEHEGSNFVSNNITARIEAQIGLAIERTDSAVYGDFTAV